MQRAQRLESPLCHMAVTPDDYQMFGLRQDLIEPWEDGVRTDTEPGSYEWWYFDAHLEDGSTLVTTFYTKNPLDPGHALQSFVTVHLERPRADPILFEDHHPAHHFSASPEARHVCIADDVFRGDLHHYEIHTEHHDTAIDVDLVGQVPAWRPATGHLIFGESDEHYFASPASGISCTSDTRDEAGGAP